MPNNWKLMMTGMPGHFEGYIVSLLGQMITDPDAREQLMAFEKGAQKGTFQRFKHKAWLKMKNKPGQKAGIAGATMAGAAIGGGIGFAAGALPAIPGLILGAAVGLAIGVMQIPVNQAIATKFEQDYDKIGSDWKSVSRHLIEYETHMKKFQTAIEKNDPDNAGHHLYKATHHMAKVKVLLAKVEEMVDGFKSALPTDDQLKDQLLRGLRLVEQSI